MNKEISNKLKRAGYKQPEGRFGSWWNDTENEGELCYAPKLHELIEACGNQFESLVLLDEKDLPEKYWRAYPTDDAYYDVIDGDCDTGCCGYETGETPEEAVANLWLALNEK